MHQILNRFNTLVNSQSVPEVGSAVKKINENTMPHTRATTRSPDVKKSAVPAYLRKSRREPQLTLIDLEKEKPRSAVKETHGSSIDDIVAQHQSDITQFKNTGELSDALYSALYDYYTDNGEMPYGTAKARDGDPYEWIGDRLDQHLGESSLPNAHSPMKEATIQIDFDKVLDAIAALYGDDMWENDAMQDLAHDLEQAGPTDRELDFIIAKGKLPKRLANTQFSAGDNVQFEAGIPIGAKQKSFAALAPPRNKVTFADKIAGAKKEVDEMLGDVAAEAIKGALSGKQKKLDKNHNGKIDATDLAMLRRGSKKTTDEASGDNAFTAHLRPREETPRAGTVTHGAKHDTEWTSTGRKVTRRVNPDGTSAGAEDDSASAVKRSAGAPKKHINPRQERVTAKSRKQDRTAHGQTGFAKGKKVKEEDDMFLGNKSDEYDREGKMAKQELSTATRAVRELQSIIDSDENLPEWVQAKITKAVDYLDTSSDYMKSKDNETDSGDEEELDEKAKSKKQQKFMGMVHAAQKGEKPASKEVGKVAKTMKKSDAEDFASTKHKGLPEKKKPEAKKEKSVEENTVAGSIAPSAGPAKDSGAPKKEKASGGAMQFGKGVYEGRLNNELNSKVEKIINEGFSVSTNVGEDGKQSITINATDEDAAKLVEMLKLAGLTNSGSYGDACPHCGQSGCGCSQVAEDYANSPEPHESDSITMLKTLSGGLNGMKSTGQSTGAPPNLDPRRQVTMSETAATVVKENETRLWDIYQAIDKQGK